MLKHKIYLSALCAAMATLSFVPVVSAETMEGSGFTVGVDYGRTESKRSCAHITNCDDSDKGPKIEIGYDFNKTFGLELGYTSFGTVFDSNDSSASIKQKANAITFSGLASLPVGEYFGVYGRVGVARYDTNNTGNVEGVAVKDEHGNSLLWGAGVKFNATEQFAVRVEYQSYSDLSDVSGRKDDVQGLFAGVNYRF